MSINDKGWLYWECINDERNCISRRNSSSSQMALMGITPKDKKKHISFKAQILNLSLIIVGFFFFNEV